MIRTQRTNGKDWKTINKQLPTNYKYGDLKTLLDEVRRNEHDAFKINIAFWSMLYDTVNKVYRYYYISTNHYLFDRAFAISTNHDMTDFFDMILSLNLAEKYYFQRPSSGWVLVGVPNVEIRVMRIRGVPNVGVMSIRGVPIGAGVQLPAHIKNSKSIVSLTRDEHNGHNYNDNLCLFRGLALHFGAAMHSLEGPTKRLKVSIEEHTGKSYDEGVEVSMLSTIEIFFNVAINVYSLQEDKIAKTVRISNLDYKADNVMHLNLYENDFSYIKKFQPYAKKFQCLNCSRILNKACNLQNVKLTSRRYYWEVSIAIRKLFLNLDTIDIHVPECDRYDPHFAV